MEVTPTKLPEVLLIEPQVFSDTRGLFKETYQRERYVAAGITSEFVQDNFSRSCRGTLRGLHYQLHEPQGKLVQVFRGEILDVAVDLRRSSETFGQHVSVVLSESNHRQLYIPPGFAHGFYVLSEVAEFSYKCSDYYHPEHEQTLLWNDSELGIDWQIEGEPVLSEKDQQGATLREAVTFD